MIKGRKITFYDLKYDFDLSSLKQLHLLSDFHIKAKCKEVDTTSFVCLILNYLFWFRSMIKEFLFAW